MLIKPKKIIGTVGYMGGLPAILEPFCWAWGQMIQYNSEYLCEPDQMVNYVKATASLHFFARNNLVEQMKGDWLVMLDTDHAPDPDVIMRMLDAVNKNNIQVATALYRHRASFGGPVIYNWDETGFAQPIAFWTKDVPVMQIDSAGAGCLFVKKEVFERIEKELKEKPFTPIDYYGEDHSFFQRCKKLKIPAYALMDIESPHLKVEKLEMKNYVQPPSVGKMKKTEGKVLIVK